jgi:hypothetical protein
MEHLRSFHIISWFYILWGLLWWFHKIHDLRWFHDVSWCFMMIRCGYSSGYNGPKNDGGRSCYKNGISRTNIQKWWFDVVWWLMCSCSGISRG